MRSLSQSLCSFSLAFHIKPKFGTVMVPVASPPYIAQGCHCQWLVPPFPYKHVQCLTALKLDLFVENWATSTFFAAAGKLSFLPSRGFSKSVPIILESIPVWASSSVAGVFSLFACGFKYKTMIFLGFYATKAAKQLLCLCGFKTELPLYKYLKMPNLEVYILLAVIFINSLPSKWHSTVV